MKRIGLLHSNLAEAEQRAALLRKAGFQVEVPRKISPEELRVFRNRPPDAFAIDLSRMPSQGRALGIAFRQHKSTRLVPIVFIEGDPEKVAATKTVMPDALYSNWPHAAETLKAAILNPPSAPVIPGTMEGYAGTPLAKKLTIKAGSAVTLLGAPDGFEQKLRALPEAVRLRRNGKGKADLVLLFARSHAELKRRFKAAVTILAERGGLWIVWPKKASPLAGDLNTLVVRAFGLDSGLVDYKICAVDETWSGLLFTRRQKKQKKPGA
jgi:hypothetical protein